MIVAVCLGCGCGDGGSEAGVGGAAVGTTASVGSSANTGPQAPYLDTVAALHGALHLFWTNETTDCDAIEGERRTAAEPFAVLFTVPGDVEDLADDSATDPSVLYTYRLRCRRGGVYSAYSEEDSRSPMVQTDPAP